MDYSWRLTKTGYVAYRSDRAYYVKMKIKTTVVDEKRQVDAQFHSIKKIGFVLGKLELAISDVLE